MRLLAALLLALFSGTANAAITLSDRLEYSCYTEISFFCQKVKPGVSTWMRCLGKQTAITARCKVVMQDIKIAMAPKPDSGSAALQVSSAPVNAFQTLQSRTIIPSKIDSIRA